MKEKILSGLRRDGAGHMAHMESAVACVTRAKANWPEVSTKRYEELGAPHHFPLNRRWAGKASIGNNEDGPIRRTTGYRSQAVAHYSMSMLAALKLQRIADNKKRHAPHCDPMADYWATVERKEYREWAQRRLR